MSIGTTNAWRKYNQTLNFKAIDDIFGENKRL